jgi:hypothetical protein
MLLLLLLLQSESGLPCEWLDKFYAPMKGPAHSLPHEQDIFAFLHEDCTPQPPCACAGLKLDGSDAGASRNRQQQQQRQQQDMLIAVTAEHV